MYFKEEDLNKTGESFLSEVDKILGVTATGRSIFFNAKYLAINENPLRCGFHLRKRFSAFTSFLHNYYYYHLHRSTVNP